MNTVAETPTQEGVAMRSGIRLGMTTEDAASAGMTMQVTELDRVEGCVIAAVSGPMDYFTSPVFGAAAREVLLDPQGQRLVLEMSGVDFFDSAGLNELLRLSRHAAGAGGCLVLAAVPPHVRQILSLTGTNAVLPTYAQVVDARRTPQ
ncbi:STAS domain-containing protein [Streptomyces sp. NPDC056468]|uniref:STAS domain-containing protein n=1 Tax=Streptomyces sp. NPDC056468 TaxID=3345830 RepID=UPI0036B16E92